MATRHSHRISGRMDLLDASGIRKVFDLAAKMSDPINLSIGQPDFDVPDNVKQAAIDAIEAGQNRYTQTQGTQELRASLASHCRDEFGWDDPDHPYLVTSGVSGGLHLALQTLIHPGDEVVFADPYFVMYSHLVNLASGIPILVDTYPDFRMTAERIEPHIHADTRMIILNTPANPTGAVSTEQELRDIADLAKKHDLLILSDEIYDTFTYDRDKSPFVSIANFYENTLLLRGFSKSHAMTGWRVGWATGPKPILEKMTMLQQYTFVCAPSMAQVAAVEALKTDMTPSVDAYQRKRDMVVDALGDSFGLVKPDGAFYAFVPAPGGDATEFVTRAIENNVLIIPGNVFSTKNTHFRLSYATAEDKLQQGLDILQALACA
jgi:aspartate aminotransferase